MGDTQQLVQRVRILRRRFFRIGRLTSVSLEGIHLFRELFCSLGESTTPVRTWHFTGAPDPGDGPQRRGKRCRVHHERTTFVEHDRRAGAESSRTFIVGIPILCEDIVQVLIDVLEVVHTEVDGVLPFHRRSVHRRWWTQRFPRQGQLRLPVDNLAVLRTRRWLGQLRNLLWTEQLQHPPVLQGLLTSLRGSIQSHGRILPGRGGSCR